MDERKKRGNRGENAVAGYLRRRGYRILERQYRCRYGEIDLIARSLDGTLCFVEVKTRSTSRFSRPCEAVTAAKQHKLRTTAQFYLAHLGEECPCRFDVAEVYLDETKLLAWPAVHYISDAFS